RLDVATATSSRSGVSAERRCDSPPDPAALCRDAATEAPRLIVLVRNLAQLDTALRQGVETLYCDFEDPKKYREAVERVRAIRCADSPAGNHSPEIFVAPPRIFKTGEEWTLRQVR